MAGTNWLHCDCCATVVCAAALLMAPATVHADGNFASFQYQVDSFEVVGNLAGYAFDDFDDGIVAPWYIEEPTAVESSDFVTLSTPGVLFGPNDFGGITFESERSSIRTDWGSDFDVLGGQGDFTATSRWAPAVPGLNQFYGMSLSCYWGPDANESSQGINLNVVNFSPAIADAVGVPPGLAIWFLKDDGLIEGGSYSVHAVSIVESHITGDVVLVLAFGDNSNEIAAVFSLDGGTTFQGPFPPFASSLDLAEDTHWYLEAEELRVVPEPATLSLLLLGGMAMLKRKRRQSMRISRPGGPLAQFDGTCWGLWLARESMPMQGASTEPARENSLRTL